MMTHSRRGFLTGLGAALAAPAAGGEADWSAIRRQFPFTEERVPMNAANLCPSPRAVFDRVTELARDIDTDCSFQNRRKFADLLERARARIAAQLGVSADEVAIVRNTSEANNIINNGLPLRPGDEVVLWDQNHPTNNVAWDVRAARFGLTVRRVATPKHPKDPGELAAVFERALSPRTRVLAVTHVSNVTGIRLPVRELAEIARRRGVYFHVDGAQSWGALRLDLRQLGCDSYSASAHKWFMGPKEAGILYVRAERVAEIWPNTVAPGWGDDADPDVKGARKFESLGQRDDACLAALETTAEFHEAIGRARVEARVLELARMLKEGLLAAGAKLVTPLEAELSAGVCVMEAPAAAREALVDRLYYEHGIAGAATGGLRLCPHVYNTREHIDRAIRAVRATRAFWGSARG
jgi:selenocysteine lyase/cysteine desulfurase